MEAVRDGRKSGSDEQGNGTESRGFSSPQLGQRYPHHYPHRADFDAADDPLGEPLTIHQVARLLGCSAWSVRHRYLPLGLPYFRIGRAGKLMFYRKQIVLWILEKQKAERR
jgi:hypothetical protein